MALVSVTRLRLRSPFYFPLFLIHAITSFEQAKKAAGNLGVQTRQQAGKTFWTLSVWEDEAAMRNYMMSGAHRQAMPKLMKWCDEASVAHWHQASTEMPGWQEAEEQIRNSGRLSRVNHPSSDHAAGAIKL